MSNQTNVVDGSNLCTLSILQVQLHAVALELCFYLLTLLGICFFLSILSSLLTLFTLCTIRGWRNSARTYYYVIGVTNLIATLSTDWQTFLVVLATWANQWFPNGMGTVMALHWELLWTPLCALFIFVTDSIFTPKVWVLILFCVHRTWIVIEPLRAPLLKRVFRPALVVGLPVGLTLFNIPHFFLSFIVNGTQQLHNVKIKLSELIKSSLNIIYLFYRNVRVITSNKR